MTRRRRAGPEDGVDPQALAGLARLANDLPLVLDVTARPARLASRATGTVDAALATLLAAVAGAIADGSWSRMKACRDPGCRWAYFDHSRNRSRGLVLDGAVRQPGQGSGLPAARLERSRRAGE